MAIDVSGCIPVRDARARDFYLAHGRPAEESTPVRLYATGGDVYGSEYVVRVTVPCMDALVRTVTGRFGTKADLEKNPEINEGLQEATRMFFSYLNTSN